MKLWNFKYKICLILILTLTPAWCFSQDEYNKRTERYRSRWDNLIPTHQKLQFAGGMGLVSLGAGWDYGKNNQWETDVFLGFLPKFSTKRNKITFTLKQNFIPWNIETGKKGFSVDPLACGAYVNTIFDNDFWVNQPDKYPENYYFASTKTRFHFYLGQRITYKIPHNKRFLSKSITFFYELSTNDLYLISAVQNSYLTPKDYLKLSFGAKLQLF